MMNSSDSSLSSPSFSPSSSPPLSQFPFSTTITNTHNAAATAVMLPNNAIASSAATTTTTTTTMNNNPIPEHCRSLFLGDLSCFCQEQDIYQVFQSYGDIETIRVMRGRDQKSLGYGFVTFVDLEATMKALEVDGTVILGRPVKVGWAKAKEGSKLSRPSSSAAAVAAAAIPNHPMASFGNASSARTSYPHHHHHHSRPQGGGGSGYGNNNDGMSSPIETAQLHFSFIAKNCLTVVTEATIRTVFEKFGQVLDINLKKSGNSLNKPNEQNGYGFIHYPLTIEGIQSALQAAEILRQVYVDRVLYDCCLTWSLEQFLAENYSYYPNKSTTTTGAPAVNQQQNSHQQQQHNHHYHHHGGNGRSVQSQKPMQNNFSSSPASSPEVQQVYYARNNNSQPYPHHRPQQSQPPYQESRFTDEAMMMHSNFISGLPSRNGQQATTSSFPPRPPQPLQLQIQQQRQQQHQQQQQHYKQSQYFTAGYQRESNQQGEFSSTPAVFHFPKTASNSTFATSSNGSSFSMDSIEIPGIMPQPAGHHQQQQLQQQMPSKQRSSSSDFYLFDF